MSEVEMARADFFEAQTAHGPEILARDALAIFFQPERKLKT